MLQLCKVGVAFYRVHCVTKRGGGIIFCDPTTCSYIIRARRMLTCLRHLTLFMPSWYRITYNIAKRHSAICNGPVRAFLQNQLGHSLLHITQTRPTRNSTLMDDSGDPQNLPTSFVPGLRQMLLYHGCKSKTSWCLDPLFSDITDNVLMGTLNPTHILPFRPLIRGAQNLTTLFLSLRLLTQRI